MPSYATLSLYDKVHSRAPLTKPSASDHVPLPSGIGINCTKLHKLPSLIKSLEDTILAHSTTRSLHMDAAAERGLFHLILYPDGADDLIYDAVSQTWIPSDAVSRPSSPHHHEEEKEEETDVMSEERRKKKEWARKLAAIVRDVQTREVQRRKGEEERGAIGLWRGVVVGGCCLVDWEGIRMLGEEIFHGRQS